MDFIAQFSRLLRRSSVPERLSSGEQDGRSGASPVEVARQRLSKFKSVYNHLLRLWRNGEGVSRDAFVAENTRVVMVQLAKLLNQDMRGPTPHLVVSFAFTNGVLRTLVQIATAFCEPGITREVLSMLQLCVDNEEEAFLEDRGLADAVPPFVSAVTSDILGRQWGEKEEEVEKVRGEDKTGLGLEARLAEVLFGVASAIRNKHLVLKAWFRPEQIYEDMDELAEEEKPTRTEDFPLFYLLLNYIAYNGRVGDFARMGLLYIVEATSYSSVLERWLIEGDMAALMASSLGALYSQLSRKLVMAHIQGEEPALCKYGTIKAITHAPFDVEIMGSLEYQEHMRTFMASLSFWQDMLIHSPYDNIRKSLLDHFQFLFLQQLLYPSLLESSDVDGGSSVAVTTYLRNILQELDHPELVSRMLSYLFGLEIKDEDSGQKETMVTRARRRKSEILFSRKLDNDERPSPEIFNLRDLVNNGLRSHNHQTVTVTLRLLSTLLTRQHQHSVPHLLRTRPLRGSDPRRSLGGHLKEVDTWIGLAASLTSYQEIEQSYEAAIYDNKNMLETHPCTYEKMNIPDPYQRDGRFKLPLPPYAIVPEDPISKSLINLLDRFLFNDIETNLDLTKTILAISCCAHLRLEGWLITHPFKYIYRRPDGTPMTPIAEKMQQETGSVDGESDAAVEDEADDNSSEVKPAINQPPAREEPAWRAEDRSPIFKALDNVVAKAESFHRKLQDFDALLAECRKQVISEGSREQPPEPPPKSSFDQSRLTAPQETPTVSGTGTPSRGHARQTSLSDRIANVFGTSPRSTDGGQTMPSLEPTPLERLEFRLSEATSTSRPRSSGKSATNAIADSAISSPSKSDKKLRRRGSEPSETPGKPMHARHRSLRGDDQNASPSPRLDRKVVPGSGRSENESSALRRAIGNESDEDEDEDDAKDPDLDSEDEDENELGSDVGEEYENGSGDEAYADMEDEETQHSDATQSTDGKRRNYKKMNGKEESMRHEKQRDITIGHLLTNIIILQEFIIEIAAMISVRGTVFDEIRFK